MIRFKKSINNKEVLLIYEGLNGVDWIFEKLAGNITTIEDSIRVYGVFYFSRNELLTKKESSENQFDEPVEFRVATRKDDYYCFPKSVLGINHDLYIHDSITLKKELFRATRSISIFRQIDKVVDGSLSIGGQRNNSIPEVVFNKLLKSFPNDYEIDKYVRARVSSVISSFVDTKNDYEEKYHKYLNKKISKKGANINSLFSESELIKYKGILEKLEDMLSSEDQYSELQWQRELSQIILFLYPQYIYIFENAPVKDIYFNKNRAVDYLLINSNGNIDIIEIKKPFDKCIVTNGTYRDNYIPLRELSGTVMQIEKYLFYLNKSGKSGEKKLQEKFNNDIKSDVQIKITNPKGIIIMGRTQGLSSEQTQDFEIIRRKYNNIIDIVTYDDLLNRLENSINMWEYRCRCKTPLHKPTKKL
jgi:hypothetical protein